MDCELFSLLIFYARKLFVIEWHMLCGSFTVKSVESIEMGNERIVQKVSKYS